MIASRVVTGLMACDEQGAIGLNNGLPAWDCPQDLEHFRQTTRGQLMIMGRKTYQCMPEQAFQQRQSFVLSRTISENADHIRFASETSHLPSLLANTAPEKNIYAVGGQELIEYLFQINCLDKFILSEITGHYAHDCKFSQGFLSALKKWPKESSLSKEGFTLNTYRNPNAFNLE